MAKHWRRNVDDENPLFARDFDEDVAMTATLSLDTSWGGKSEDGDDESDLDLLSSVSAERLDS